MRSWNSTGGVVSTTLAEQFVENKADVDDDRDQELGRGKRMRFRLRTFLSSYPNVTDCQDHLHHR
jgi:hypothetical protein